MQPIRLLRLAALVLALAYALHGWAAPATYTGSAPVRSQSDEERAAALKTALANVVIEQTGDAGILARPDVAKAVAQAQRYVLQYQYAANAEGAPLTLTAQFDSAAVDAMLAQLGLRDAAPAVAAQGAPSEAKVWIGGVRNADDWLRVDGYLEHHQLVRASRPLQARGDAVLVQLSLAGDLAQFLAAATAEHTLAVDAKATADGADAVLVLTP